MEDQEQDHLKDRKTETCMRSTHLIALVQKIRLVELIVVNKLSLYTVIKCTK